MLLSIDPGASGAVALVDRAGDLIEIHDLPTRQETINGKRMTRIDPHRLADLFFALHLMHGIDRVVIERVSARPGQGVSSTFAFGMAYGMALGAAGAVGVPILTITPSVWKRALGLTADKTAARQEATNLWPAHARTFRRVKDDGRAEAALLGRYALLVEKPG